MAGPLPVSEPAASAASAAVPELLCASAELAERGRAWAYINRCVHVPTEMDWQSGEFLDIDKRWILCSIHGASYEPADGRCVGGPCGSGRLKPVGMKEQDGRVYWYPSRDIRPVPFDDPSGEPADESHP